MGHIDILFIRTLEKQLSLLYDTELSWNNKASKQNTLCFTPVNNTYYHVFTDIDGNFIVKVDSSYVQTMDKYIITYEGYINLLTNKYISYSCNAFIFNRLCYFKESTFYALDENGNIILTVNNVHTYINLDNSLFLNIDNGNVVSVYDNNFKYIKSIDGYKFNLSKLSRSITFNKKYVSLYNESNQKFNLFNEQGNCIFDKDVSFIRSESKSIYVLNEYKQAFQFTRYDDTLKKVAELRISKHNMKEYDGVVLTQAYTALLEKNKKSFYIIRASNKSLQGRTFINTGILEKPDKNEETIFNFDYSNSFFPQGDLFGMYKKLFSNDKVGLCDADMNIIIEPIYNSITVVDADKVYILLEKDGVSNIYIV